MDGDGRGNPGMDGDGSGNPGMDGDGRGNPRDGDGTGTLEMVMELEPMDVGTEEEEVEERVAMVTLEWMVV